MVPESLHLLSSAAAESARVATVSSGYEDEDVGGSVLSQIHTNAAAAARAQLFSKQGHGSAAAAAVVAPRNPRVAKKDQHVMQHPPQSGRDNFPPLPIPARLRASSAESAHASGLRVKVPPKNSNMQNTGDSYKDNDYDIGLTLDADDSGDNPTSTASLGRPSPISSQYVDQIALSKLIQEREMKTAMSNIMKRTSSRLGGGGTPTARTSVDDFGYQREEYSVFGSNE